MGQQHSTTAETLERSESSQEAGGGGTPQRSLSLSSTVHGYGNRPNQLQQHRRSASMTSRERSTSSSSHHQSQKQLPASSSSSPRKQRRGGGRNKQQQQEQLNSSPDSKEKQESSSSNTRRRSGDFQSTTPTRSSLGRKSRSVVSSPSNAAHAFASPVSPATSVLQQQQATTNSPSTPRRRNVSERLRTLRCIAPRVGGGGAAAAAAAQEENISLHHGTTTNSSNHSSAANMLAAAEVSSSSSSQPDRTLSEPSLLLHPPKARRRLLERRSLASSARQQQQPSPRPIANNKADTATTTVFPPTHNRPAHQQPERVPDTRAVEDEPPGLVPMEEELPPLQSMVEDDTTEEPHDYDDEEEDDEDVQYRVTGTTTSTEESQNRGVVGPSTSSSTSITVDGARSPARLWTPRRSTTSSYNINNPNRELRPTTPSSSSSSLSPPQRTNSSSLHVFPAAPISPAHRVMIRGGSGHNSTSLNSSHHSNSSATPTTTTTTNARMSQPEMAVDDSNDTTSSSSPSPVGGSSLGEMLRRSGGSGSNHGGTNESVATGSNRSTDTAATATMANHGRSNSNTADIQEGKEGEELDQSERTGSNRALRNTAGSTHPSESLANPTVSATSDSSTSTPNTRFVAHPSALVHDYTQRQHSLRNVIPLSDHSGNINNHNQHYHSRRLSVSSNFSFDYEDDTSHQHAAHDTEFFPRLSHNNEWMGRSIESLILGHVSAAPILVLEDYHHGSGVDDGSFSGSSGGDYLIFRRRSTASTFGGGGRRRSSQGSSFMGGRRGSLSLVGNVHGGTLANYFSHRRRQQQYHHASADYVDRSYNDRMGRRGSATTTGTMYRRRSSVATTASTSERSIGLQEGENDNNRNNSTSGDKSITGPNIVFSILARETTGKTSFPQRVPVSRSLRAMGGTPLFNTMDKPAGGIATEVAFLAAAIDIGDWTETHQIISRLTPRLTGDPMNMATAAGNGNSTDQSRGGTARGTVEDANLPPTAPKYYAGGGRLGLERDAFCLAGGVQTMMRVFREKSFVGQEIFLSYDARDLSKEIVSHRLAHGWNEVLVSLRELVYAIPALVEDGTVLDNGDFLPFLFTLLAHDSCFEAAAALIEEILSLLSQAPQQASQQQQETEMDSSSASPSIPSYRATGRVIPSLTFYLGNVPDLYRLWHGFNCRQLAHFCRILALLVFEPEDRQSALSEKGPGMLKSIELLQLRRNRAVRAGRDSTVDMNQAILLGDGELLSRLLKLLKVSNFAPSIRRFSPYHIMAHNPFIVDTLLMLGFGEFEYWGEIDRQERLARDLLISEDNGDESANDDGENEDYDEEWRKPYVSELGSIADWLENLSETLSEESEPANQLLRIMTTAQQAGLVVGSRRRHRHRHRPNGRGNTNGNNSPSRGWSTEPGPEDSTPSFPIVMGGTAVVDTASIQGLASFAGMLTDQILVRRLYQNVAGDGGDPPDWNRMGERAERQHPIQTPLDAANSLQFNAMILGPYQVELMFVLCTFLGGKRKLDAQDQVQELGMIPILEEMFERLPWFQMEQSERPGDRGDRTEDDPEGRRGESSSTERSEGVNGTGCECTPENALCVQYLRLLHNFCDRDCDNYDGRQLLLSPDEREWIFGGGFRNGNQRADCKPGLLSKIIRAFISESDESPYRFWLASCIESYLRGSSADEQVFLAKSGLLQHLVRDVSSERLHCSGSLQTSFDLLGELGKGNAEVFRLLVSELDEEAFRKLMGVASTNLVDSNVFIRSLLLSLERLSAANCLRPLYVHSDSDDVEVNRGSATMFDWTSIRDSNSRSYLTHTWWDTRSIALDDLDESFLSEQSDDEKDEVDENDDGNETTPEEERVGAWLPHRDEENDWFPSLELARQNGFGGYLVHRSPLGLEESVGHNGWLFTPATTIGESGRVLGFAPGTHLPNSIERLSWFLAANQGRLLRDLLSVVDLRNINHENICCLNTAVVIAIFAHRRHELAALLQELRQLSNNERQQRHHGRVGDRSLTAMARSEDVTNDSERHSMSAASSSSRWLSPSEVHDHDDVMRNFRQVLWFWREYYTHRGRDRLSLEFSSHLRFQEWDLVVSLLGADDGSTLSLVPGPIRLPPSPYQRSARGVADQALIRGL